MLNTSGLKSFGYSDLWKLLKDVFPHKRLVTPTTFLLSPICLASQSSSDSPSNPSPPHLTFQLLFLSKVNLSGVLGQSQSLKSNNDFRFSKQCLLHATLYPLAYSLIGIRFYHYKILGCYLVVLSNSFIWKLFVQKKKREKVEHLPCTRH